MSKKIISFNKIYFGFVICLFHISFLFSQNKGFVIVDSSKEPISGAHVYLNGMGIVSDDYGKFSLQKNLNPSDTVRISHIGYHTAFISVKTILSQDTVYLKGKTNQLEGVTLSSDPLKRTIHFQRLRSMLKPLYDFASIAYDNKIYVFGGNLSLNSGGLQKVFNENSYLADADPNVDPDSFLKTISRMNQFIGNNYTGYSNRIYEYNIKSDSWRKLELRIDPRTNLGAARIEDLNVTVVLGGKQLSDNRGREVLPTTIELIDFDSNDLKTLNVNPHNTVNPLILSIPGGIILLGGSTKLDKNGKKEYSKDIHLFNLKDKKWSKIGEMPEGRETQGILHNGRVYLFGGERDGPVSEISSYDILQQVWKTEGHFFEPVDYIGITSFKEMIYMYQDGRITTFNLKTRYLKEYLINLSVKNAELIYHEGSLFLFGGKRTDGLQIEPQRSLIKIDIQQFELTKPKRIKKI